MNQEVVSPTPEQGLFSAVWAKRFAWVLESDPRFREQVGTWSCRLLFSVKGDSTCNFFGLWLELTRGRVREARPAVLTDRRRADYELAASAQAWKDLLSGARQAGAALQSGELELLQGSRLLLLPYLSAARALLESARRIEALSAEVPS